MLGLDKNFKHFSVRGNGRGGEEVEAPTIKRRQGGEAPVYKNSAILGIPPTLNTSSRSCIDE